MYGLEVFFEAGWVLLVFALIGAFCVAKVSFSFISLLFRHLFYKTSILKKLAKAEPQPWAVVTGASDGIGAAYARGLSLLGFNIFLISRTQEKLDAVATSIRERNPKVRVETLVVDFSTANLVTYENITKHLHNYHVNILVNNVGLSNDVPEYFYETDLQRIQDIITVNIHACTLLTRFMLPVLQKNKEGGLIINVSSGTALFPTPLLSVYGATKAYVSAWSQALSAELAGQKVRVEDHVPFYVVSNMSRIRKASFTIPTPDGYVRHALEKIGLQDSLCPFFAHAIMAWFIERLPLSRVMNIVKRENLAIRKRFLAKKEKPS